MSSGGDDHPSQEKSQRRQQVLARHQPSSTMQIADAIIIKKGEPFLVTRPDGILPRHENVGYGLYYHDCRFLDGYTLTLNGLPFTVLAAEANKDFAADFSLANLELKTAEDALVPPHTIGLAWRRVLESKTPALHEVLSLRNYSRQQVRCELAFQFSSQFDDIYVVRGLVSLHPGRCHRPRVRGGCIFLLYDGADGIYRSVSVHFFPEPTSMKGGSATYIFDLAPTEEKDLALSIVLAENRVRQKVAPSKRDRADFRTFDGEEHQSIRQWLALQTSVASDKPIFNRVFDRALMDLRMLEMRLHDHTVYAAGIPWFTTLFGRDSLITGMQTLAFFPRISASVLRTLATLQGTKVDAWRDEEPGKIMHELRIGELARLDEIPENPNYSTVDATVLFLILLCEYVDWTADLSLFHELRPHVDRALHWMDRYGDRDGDCFLEYDSPDSHQGLVNQGWKDTGNAMVGADGSLAMPPIALAEVQGYAYLARQRLACLLEAVGDGRLAAQLREEASRLRERFNQQFWVPEMGCLAMALQGDKSPLRVVSSNAGQALWGEIVDPEKARCVVRHLVGDDLFSGWGVRTLSAREKAYNPVGYHLGTVWPHDNSLIVMGLKKYRHEDEAVRILDAMLEAAIQFKMYRLPEVFAGFPRLEDGEPVHYPVACHPQAWAAGAIPYMLRACLGLFPDALANVLRIERPALPSLLDSLELHGLHVGHASVDLRFSRTPSAIQTDILAQTGDLRVEVH